MQRGINQELELVARQINLDNEESQQKNKYFLVFGHQPRFALVSQEEYLDVI